MEDGIVTVIIVLAVVWYFGSAINSIVAKSGKMSEREYTQFEQNQAFRLAKGKEELKTKIAKFQSENKSEMTDEEMNKFLGI